MAFRFKRGSAVSLNLMLLKENMAIDGNGVFSDLLLCSRLRHMFSNGCLQLEC